MAPIPLAGLGVHGFILIALTLLFIAVPFFISIMTEKDHWLPIISGITFNMGVIASIDIIYPHLETIPIGGIQNELPAGLLPLCISLILFFLWRLRFSIPVNWKELLSKRMEA